MADKWNRNPNCGEGTLAGIAINKLLSYPIIGYLPDEECAVLVLDGENENETSNYLESSGFAVTKLCDPQSDIIGCIPEELQNMPNKSFGFIYSSSWLCDELELEKTSRLAFDKLREGGMFIGCIPNRLACSLSMISKSMSNAIELLDDNTESQGNWDGVSECHSPQSLIVTLEAVGFTVVDIYGWQIALSMLSEDHLKKGNWTQNELDNLITIEYRLSQERNLIGCAPTIQFVAKKPNPAEATFESIDRQ